MSKAMAWSWVRVSCLVLLFSGCLAAVVNKEIPDPDDVTKIDLTAFTWSDTGVGAGTYLSLEVCSSTKVTAAVGTLYTLVYSNKGGTLLKNFEGGTIGSENPLDEVCVKFTETEDITVPYDEEITYELHIASEEDEFQFQSGSATFTIDQTKYDTTGKTFITCAETHYTRSEDATCKDGVLLADEATCYQTAGSDLPTPQGCLTDDTATPNTVDVCLTDAAPVTADSKGKVVVTSLAYNGEAPVTGADVEIDYTKGLDSPTNLEIIMQDILGEVTFNVGTCDTADLKSCSIAEYTQAVVTYQVCAVAVDATPTVTSTATDKSGTITDLNLAGYPDTETNRIEFGFSNAREDPDRYYFASVVGAADKKEAKTVGIDCQGVATGHTCYGFLDITGLGDDVQLTVEYGNGTTNPGDVTSNNENKIIGTYTKPASSTPAPLKGKPQVEE